jgi:1-acyl-sn-glycerol-3-phosphate acyltransferase
MDEKHLGGYFFFRWLGAFGMGLESAADSVAGVRHAVRLLNRKSKQIAWIFVQGAMTPPLTPIVARPGAVFISRHANAPLLPVVLRYEWRHESKPTILMSIGGPLPPETEPDVLAASMNTLFTNLNGAVADPAQAGLEAVNPPRLSMNKRWDYMRHLATGRRGVFERDNR